ncbi:hypothetical protein [Methylobacterium frigidaeris]|uniref:Uncharacterized protein n=1 Tax=Methylobacterium frigidaeris TaxID=2038277 RepID=A0AA37M208_9HYPH|nr:hypothetical protein [Methylobacterium frigidaeris]PIK70903.1 hypothetical protein CS379_22200 [Methylobacterium frigidaeris]GJD60353.1 hypothetical protein MPEAHAMD_0489 [Methylobacterium frigidaeris]
MDNIIRPDFQRAAKARAGETRKPGASSPVQYVKTYGEVGSHAVSLVRTRSGLGGDVYQVVIDMPGGQVGPVGVEPATKDGMFDADRVGIAVLRTLELLALRSGDFDVA